MSRSQLHELIGSRICHDLISPLGAISNGLELIGLSGAPLGPEMQLVSESVENANARIRYFRLAYGQASPDHQVAAAEARTILDAFSAGGRINMNWMVASNQSRLLTKLAFLLIQCLETAMPRGGTIDVTEASGEWSVTCHTDKLNIDPDLWQSLATPGGSVQVHADKVQFILAPVVAREANKTLRFDSSANSARLRF